MTGPKVPPVQHTSSDSRTRILLIAPEPFFHAAGTPLNIRSICRALTEGGYEVHLLTLPLGADVAMPGLVYHRTARIPGIMSVPVGFSLGKAAYNLILALHLFGLMVRLRPLAVHAFEEAAFYASPMARAFGAVAVMDIDSDISVQLADSGSKLAGVLAPVAAVLRRFALRRSKFAITVADSLTTLVALESPRTVVREIRDVPPEETVRAADAHVVEDIRRELELGAGPTIVYTGNLDRRQGVEILVQAMAQVFRRIPDARLILVGGTDAEVARIRDLTESLGIGERVVLTGKRPTNLMPEYMALASVLASPRLEPLVTPLKIYAYMASGRPIVATDLPTHTQVLDESAAFLAAPTPEGFAAGIFDALSDPERATRRGLEARRLALTVHSYDSFKRQVLELYASVEKMRRSSSAREREAG